MRGPAYTRGRTLGHGHASGTLASVTTPENWLLCNKLRALCAELDAANDETREAIWRRLEFTLEKAGAEEDADLMLPVLERSLPDVHQIVAGWQAGTLKLPEWDNAVLKRALKAYRKRLKLARLDDESSSSRNPLSRGDASSILGVRPPEHYPQEVWDLLVAQGKLREAGYGLLELTTG